MSTGEYRSLTEVMEECWADFEISLKEYLLSTEMTQTVRGMWENLKFHLCIWEDEEPSQAIRSIRTDKIIPVAVNQFGTTEMKEVSHNTCRQAVFDMMRERCGKDGLVYVNTKSVDNITYSGGRNGISDCFSGIYQAAWAATYEGKISEQIKVAISVFLKFIAKNTNNLNLVERADKEMWQQCGESLGYDFITWYKDAVFDMYPTPGEEIIRRIAAEPYENRDNKGMICFVNNECLEQILQDEIPGFAYFEGKDCPEGGMEETDNLSNSRKMLELCGEGERYLLVSAKSPYSIRGVLSAAYGEAYIKDKLTIRFMGKGNWRISKGGEVFLVFENGRYYADLSLADAALDDQMKKMSPVFENSEGSRELFKRIFQRLQGQSHGALMIVARDAQSEVQILCSRFKRGTQIRGVEYGREENLELLDGMASVDGAILVDYEGICYGFGVILDGDAKIEGDLGRGSRYNSSRNYIVGTERYAVIVSEDKTKGIEIISGIELQPMERNGSEQAFSN